MCKVRGKEGRGGERGEREREIGERSVSETKG